MTDDENDPGDDAGVSGSVDKDGTWSDPRSDRHATSGATPDITYRDEIEARKQAAKHVRAMQRTIIYGLGGLIIGVFIAMLLTLSLGAIAEPFAQTIIQAIISPLVAALGVVVGYFFGDKNN